MTRIHKLFVLKCGPDPVETPSIGAQVRIKGRSETFYVLRVDPEKRIADLIQENGMHMVEESVPFDQIHVESAPHGHVTYIRLRRRAADKDESDLLAG